MAKNNNFSEELLEKIRDLGDRDFELMLLGWLRYSLGRQTYIVDACSSYISNLLSVLSDWCLNNIENDLEDFAYDVDRGIRSWGMDYDKKSWTNLWDKLIIELSTRNKVD